jgi:predicted RNA binding protein YcfA (HicA-like mRNA interferase family)
MMRYAVFLIVSLLSANVSLAIPPGNKNLTDSKTNSYTSLNNDFSLVVSNGFITSSKDNYPVQLGAFRLKSNAETLYTKIKEQLKNDAKIIFEDGFYKVRMKRLAGSKVILKHKTDSFKDTVVIKPVDSIKSGDTLLPSILATDSLRTAKSLPDTKDTLEKATKPLTNFFFVSGDSPWLKRINYFGKSVAFVKALIITIISCISMMIILLIIILLNRNRLEKEEHLHQFLMEKYQTLIVDYLFGNASPEEFRSIASDTYRRQVLIDQMIDVSVNLKGGEGKKLLSLYKHLSLDRDSLARAYDYRWHKKIKGFRELAFMNIKSGNDAIYKALNSSNDILRMEAQIALVRLSDENPFEFLSHLSSSFSLWEQITLHDLIIQHNITPPSFQKWLTSPNPSVVMFSLRMIREFKQTESEDMVRETLLHNDPSVRQLAVQVAGDLQMRSTYDTMKHMYKNQEYNICLEIIRAIGKMPDISMMGFLKLVLDKEDDVQLQIEATKAIENIGEEGVKELVKLMKSEYKNYTIIIRHVLDRRIF